MGGARQGIGRPGEAAKRIGRASEAAKRIGRAGEAAKGIGETRWGQRGLSGQDGGGGPWVRSGGRIPWGDWALSGG